MDNGSIKDNIRKFRKERNMTQGELANRLGISATGYRELEKGNTAILNANFMKIAQILEVTVEELILGFHPVYDESKAMNEAHAVYGNKVENLEKRIEEMSRHISLLEDNLRAKDEIIKDKNEIISMLKKMLVNEN